MLFWSSMCFPFIRWPTNNHPIIDYELDKAHKPIEQNLADPNVESFEHDFSYVEDMTPTRCIQCFSIGWFLLGGKYGTA